jgi:glycine hydroxymethyltransferase
MHSVLFVCTANICRSPMAMGLFRSFMEINDQMWKIDSAGVFSQSGLPASEFSRIVLLNKGIDIGGYRSKPVSIELISGFNIILTMEERHQLIIKSEFPYCAHKIYKLSEMIHKDFDIRDPYGLELQDYVNTAVEIDNILKEGYKNIEYLSGLKY